MRSLETACSVAASPSQVWGHLSDYANLLRLCGAQGRADLVAGRAGEVGAGYDAVVAWEGLESRYRVRLTEAEPDTSLCWTARSRGTHGQIRFRLEPDGERTRVTMSYGMGLGRATQPLEPFAWALMSRLGDTFVRNLRRLTSEQLRA